MPALAVRAPGRVNLIGEHTDYNGGFVMPAAIGYETRASAALREDRIVRVESQAAGESISFDLRDVRAERRGNWTDYARGIVAELLAAKVPVRGADVRIVTTLPLGGGLSSSASFDVALALALLSAAQFSLERAEIARLSQRADAAYVGVRSGIMDQFAVLFGKAGHVLLLDTRSLEYRYYPLPPKARLVICNTMVKHALASGAYNERRSQCERALERLQRWFPSARDLRDIPVDGLQQHENDLPRVLYRRARHVITENERVLDAAQSLDGGDARGLGELMNASHESLRADYEVSCAELDTMVAIARACDGVYGARMTGGGFGGCTVNLVDAACVPAFEAAVREQYQRQTGMVPDMYDGTPVDGAGDTDV